MSFSGQPPYTYLYPDQPPPVPQAGHFLIGPPPFHPPPGHEWIVVPPTVTPPTPATWRLDPELVVNERGENVTGQGAIFRIPMPQPVPTPAMAPQGSPPLMPPPPTNSPTGSYPGPPPLWGVPFPHPFFQGGPPRPSSTPSLAEGKCTTSSPPSASPPPPAISRQTSRDPTAAPLTTPPPTSPTRRPRTQSQSRAQEPYLPLHFRHVHFLDGDDIIPTGAHSRPSSRAHTPLDPRTGTLETGPPLRGRSTTASAFKERELPETRGRARNRTRARAPYGSAGRDTNLTFSSGPDDSGVRSVMGALTDGDGNSDSEYPQWPECELCERKPATKKLGRDRQIDACDACFIEALRAEHRVRTGGGRE